MSESNTSTTEVWLITICAGNGACPQVARRLGKFAIRSSNQPETAIELTDDEMLALVAGYASGEFT